MYETVKALDDLICLALGMTHLKSKSVVSVEPMLCVLDDFIFWEIAVIAEKIKLLDNKTTL